MKKLSDEFVLTVGMLITAFFMFQTAILPSMAADDQQAAVAQTTKTSFPITMSKSHAGTFDYSYVYAPTKSLKEATFEPGIIPFNDARATLATDGTMSFGLIRDAWNYPVKENAFMGMRPSSAKSGGRSDEDENIPGLVNCRTTTDITGYFKAYFEDVALENNAGYDHPTLGVARREAVCAVLQDIAALIKLDETTVTPDILFSADTGNMPSGALAAASAYTGYYATGLDDGSLHKHIISHIDPTPTLGMFDAFVLTKWNGVSWDVDSNLNTGTYDFHTVMTHEILHTLGFRGLLPAVISANSAHVASTFNAFSYRNDTFANPFIDPTTLEVQAPAGAPSSWFVENHAVYRGVRNIVGATPDGARPVYSPYSWAEGSSLSHFDMARTNGTTYVMNPSIPTGVSRLVHQDEKEVLCHLGYAVEGLAGCAGTTPWAEGDALSFTPGDAFCVRPLENDEAFTGTAIGYDMNLLELNPGDTVTYYVGNNCNGATLPTFAGASSLMFSSAAVDDMRIMEYRIRDNVTNRISHSAPIALSSCTAAEDQYLCNGGFENALINPNNPLTIQVQDCPSQAPYLCPLWGSPDIYTREFDFSSNWLNAGPSDTHDGVPNDRYLYGAGGISGPLSAGMQTVKNEKAYLKTKSALPPGQYLLSWYGIYTSSPSQVSSIAVDAYLTEGPVTEINAFDLDAAYEPAANDLYQSVPVVQDILADVTDPESWTSYQTLITVPDNGVDYRYLILEPKRTIATNVTYLSGVRNAFDDISLVRVSDAPSGGTIAGRVYRDIDEDGTPDTGEDGLAGVTVGLFEAGESEPAQTAETSGIPNLGAYHFASLPNGTYRVALIEEPAFADVTEPSDNMLIPGFSHAEEVVITNGGLSSLHDFGVVLQDTDLPHVNIHIKKILADSTLSLTDRNITWRIEASNDSLAVATDIEITDTIPAGLLYYAHVTLPPATFDSASGVWHLMQLGPHESAVLYLTTKVPLTACGVKTNTAALTSLGEFDTDVLDNTSSASIKLRSCLTDAPTRK